MYQTFIQQKIHSHAKSCMEEKYQHHASQILNCSIEETQKHTAHLWNKLYALH